MLIKTGVICFGTVIVNTCDLVLAENKCFHTHSAVCVCASHSKTSGPLSLRCIIYYYIYYLFIYLNHTKEYWDVITISQQHYSKQCTQKLDSK